MKSSAFLVTLGSLVGSAIALHGLLHAHRRAHESKFLPRHESIASTVFATCTIFSTIIEEVVPAPTSTATATSTTADAQIKDLHGQGKAVQVSTTSSSTKRQPPALATGTPKVVDGYGITYTAFRADRQCKTTEEIKKDFATFKGVYSSVRLYGVDCDQVATTLPAAVDIGIKLMLGIYDIDKADEQADIIIESVGPNWKWIHSISVGNEAILRGASKPDQVVAAVKLVREKVRKAGFEGPVLTVDMFQTMADHPQLCEASDIVGVVMHPFFDYSGDVSNAGNFMKMKMNLNPQSCRNKDYYIMETGWPWKGRNNGLAVPGMQEQTRALQLIQEAWRTSGFSKDKMVLFAPFNEMWKAPGDFGAEQYWGIGGAYAPSEV